MEKRMGAAGAAGRTQDTRLRILLRLPALPLYTFLHFLVDFACIYALNAHIHRLIDGTAVYSWLFCAILYNMIAFAGQLPVGILGDYFRRDDIFIGIGLGFLCAAYALCLGGYGGAVLLVILLGIGNAFFHIGGGLDTMRHAGGRCADIGIFVCSGAFGVFLGNRFPRIFTESVCRGLLTGLFFALLFFLLLIVLRCIPAPRAEGLFTMRIHGSVPLGILCAVCCFTVVVLRSFAGTAFLFPWNKGVLAVCMSAAIVLGKAAGGLLADRFGLLRTVIVSLLLSGVCLLFGLHFAPAGLLGVFLFQMTMPLTLTLLGRVFPNAKGMAFGLLTLALFVGSIPSFLMPMTSFANHFLYAGLAVLSLLLLLPAVYYDLHQQKGTVNGE